MHGDAARDTDHATTEDPADPAAIDAFAAELAPAAAVDSNVALRPQQLHELFVRELTRLVDCLRGGVRSESGGRAPYDVGHEASVHLVGANITGPAALPTVLQRVRERLPQLAGGVSDEPRLAALTSGLAAGYVFAVRERLLDEQESIKRSALLAKEEADRLRRRSEARFRAVFNGTGIGIGLGDLEGRIMELNPAMCEIVGFAEQDLLGRSVLDFIHPTDKQRLANLYEGLTSGAHEHFSDEFQVINSSGQPVWTHVTMSMMPETEDGARYAIATVENVSELQLLRAQYNRTIDHDALTGLPNTRRLEQRMQDLLDEAEPDEQVALVFFDIDGFKVLNDGLGRDTGDRMLLSMATTLRTVFGGGGNIVARVAGDGFAALVRAPESIGAVINKVDEVRHVVAQPHYVGKSQDGVALSLSVGITVHESITIQPGELVRAAEITLHRAKAKGKAQWMLNDPALNERDRRRLHLGAVMPGALETGEFSLVFQPVRELDGGKLHSYFAGLRWQRTNLGLLDEAEFLPLAEETGLIVGLERWAITELCRQIAHWRHRLGATAPLVDLAVTARTARDPDLVGMVGRALRDNELEAGTLALHVPMHELTDPDAEPTESIARLGEMGVLVGADGFGSGPNLFDLAGTPVRVVRLVSEACARAANPAVAEGIRAFTAMAHGLGTLVMAPGVEDEQQRAALLAAGVDLASGPAIGEPVTASALAAAML